MVSPTHKNWYSIAPIRSSILKYPSNDISSITEYLPHFISLSNGGIPQHKHLTNYPKGCPYKPCSAIDTEQIHALGARTHM